MTLSSLSTQERPCPVVARNKSLGSSIPSSLIAWHGEMLLADDGRTGQARVGRNSLITGPLPLENR